MIKHFYENVSSLNEMMREMINIRHHKEESHTLRLQCICLFHYLELLKYVPTYKYDISNSNRI